MRGLFLTFEGIDGCGKSTQLSRVAQVLSSEGLPVVVTREPGGTPIAEKIRNILISPQNSEMSDTCELMLYMAARAQHVSEKIIPALKSGAIILCDRFQEASFAYQGFGRGIALDFLRSVNDFATGGVTPDLTFVFDITVDESVRRLDAMDKAKDRLEQSGTDFYERIRNGYLSLASLETDRIVVIDGSGTVDEITELLYHHILRIRASINDLQ